MLDPKRPWMHLDPYRRYQTALSVENLYPNLKNGLCGCGCGKPLTKGKRRWATKACLKKALDRFYVIKGDQKEIRKQVYARDKGACRHCGLIDDQWQADHIIAVVNGGGACELSNFQTLCLCCHQIKSKIDINAKSRTQ